MADHFIASIEALQQDLQKLEKQIVQKKTLINMLCEHAKLPPLYSDAELMATDTPHVSRGDEFFNKPLNTSIKTLLSQRKAAGRGPITAEEIHDGLIAGGYDKFPSDRQDALNGLKISLGKSSHTFVKLPNGTYGLADWYDIPKKPKAAATNGTKPADAPTITPLITPIPPTVGEDEEDDDEAA